MTGQPAASCSHAICLPTQGMRCLVDEHPTVQSLLANLTRESLDLGLYDLTAPTNPEEKTVTDATATEKRPADQLADLIGPDNARAAIQAGWDSIRHTDTTDPECSPFIGDYIANILTAAVPALTAARPAQRPSTACADPHLVPEPAEVDYAVRVTLQDGASSIRHEDDPFTLRSVAEQFAANARLGRLVTSAEVVCRNVWHGPWTVAPAGSEVQP